MSLPGPQERQARREAGKQARELERQISPIPYHPSPPSFAHCVVQW
ncbi:MAG: hypothetical protein HC884_08895 [Chloroflexaceae bacterium]|nr:hypothetical protein [Chloroflexaceae bacterium]